MYCKKGDIILDPFNGTGTTAIACRNLNMDYIGVELS
jgi:DNA modification methylase